MPYKNIKNVLDKCCFPWKYLSWEMFIKWRNFLTEEQEMSLFSNLVLSHEQGLEEVPQEVTVQRL